MIRTRKAHPVVGGPSWCPRKEAEVGNDKTGLPQRITADGSSRVGVDTSVSGSVCEAEHNYSLWTWLDEIEDLAMTTTPARRQSLQHRTTQLRQESDTYARLSLQIFSLSPSWSPAFRHSICTTGFDYRSPVSRGGQGLRWRVNLFCGQGIAPTGDVFFQESLGLRRVCLGVYNKGFTHLGIDRASNTIDGFLWRGRRHAHEYFMFCKQLFPAKFADIGKYPPFHLEEMNFPLVSNERTCIPHFPRLLSSAVAKQGPKTSSQKLL